jgi:hypothetical protein
MAATHAHPDLIEKLAEGIADLTSSGKWKRYLEFQSRFHRYSYGNAMLIASQRGDATLVAGFAAWRRLNRCVRKGERAIWILAPMVHRKKMGDDGEGDPSRTGRDRSDAVPGDRGRTGGDARAVWNPGEIGAVRGFKFVPVFDVAQTDGEELPTVCDRLIGDDPLDLYETLVDVAGSIGFRVEDHRFMSGTNGDCSHAERRIRVESGNLPAQRVKTLVHEIAHAMLHAQFDNRALAELEAESIAYVVCHALGIDSGGYSFGYVTTWAGGGERAIAAIRASCDSIQKAASPILRLVEPAVDRWEAA